MYAGAVTNGIVGGGFSIEKKGAMRKSDPTLNGALVHKEAYGKGYLPDSPSVLS